MRRTPCLLQLVLTAAAAMMLVVFDSAPGAAVEPPRIVASEPRVSGVTLVRLEGSDPTLPQIGYALRIDLRTEGLSFVTTPSNGDAPLETASRKVSEFAHEHGLQAAINGSFYDPCCSYLASEPRQVLGLAIADGERVSEPQKGFEPTLLITRDNRARLVDVGPSAEPGLLDEVWTAVAGNHWLLRDGENVGLDGARHPRTAVGLSRDGQTLFWLAIDGRQPGHSEGATERETAAWLLELGAWQGINLDGGGSTAMVVADRAGLLERVNRPAGLLERSNANNLGLRAPLLPPLPRDAARAVARSAALGALEGTTERAHVPVDSAVAPAATPPTEASPRGGCGCLLLSARTAAGGPLAAALAVLALVVGAWRRHRVAAPSCSRRASRSGSLRLSHGSPASAACARANHGAASSLRPSASRHSAISSKT